MQQIYLEKAISMIQNLYTNDTSFKGIVNSISIERLRQLVTKHLPWENMFISLVYIDLEIANYIFGEEEGFLLCRGLDEHSISLKVARCLYTMDKNDMRLVYRQFADDDMVLTDMLALTREERAVVIADLWNWNLNDLRNVDVIIAN